MRIIQVTHSFYPEIGGIESHVYELSHELSKKNDVIVYAAGRERKDEFIGKVLVKRYPSFRFPGVPVNISPWLKLALLSERGDIYHSHGYFSPYPLIASVVAKLKGKPFVFTFHGMPRPASAYFSFLLGAYSLLAAPVFLALSGRVISVAGKNPAGLEKYSGKVIFIPNGTPPSLSCGSSFASQKKISYIGRLSQDKGVETLVSAFSKLGKKGLCLSICGNDWGEKKNLVALAEKLGVDAEFSELPYGKMADAYCASKAVVLPSRYEGFPLVWLEAIACKRPVFSTRVGESKTFFAGLFGKEANRFLFDGEGELVSKLNAFLKDEKGYAPLIEKANAALRKEYNWKTIAQMTESEYRKLLAA